MTTNVADIRGAGQAALEAGFTEASVWAHHLPALDGLGLRVGVIEAATAWANGNAQDAAEEAHRLAGLVAEHGAARVLAACLEPSIADFARASDNLGRLTEAIAAAGAQVCVEFLPWSGVPDLATAWSLVKPLEAGLVLDTWHWVRQPGGPAFDVLRTLPGERVVYVQVCDAAESSAEELMVEAMTGRLLPGDGTVDFAAVFATLADIGAHPYIAAEVFNHELVMEHGPGGAAERIKRAAESVVPTG